MIATYTMTQPPPTYEDALEQLHKMRVLMGEIFQETAPGRIHDDPDSYLPPDMVLDMARMLGKYLPPEDQAHLKGLNYDRFD